MEHPKRSAAIHVPLAQAFQKAPVEFRHDVADGKVAVFDPERPSLGPNELLAEAGGMLDPSTMNHGCPYCKTVMRWSIFNSHMPECRREFHSLHPKNFPGATRKDAI